MNVQLVASGSTRSFRSFQDSTLCDALCICDLIDAIQPSTIDHSMLRTSNTHDDNLANAKYAITVARKLGAKIYALPEDIVECKPKMMMTVFACLMARDYRPNMGAQQTVEATGVAGTLED